MSERERSKQDQLRDLWIESLLENALTPRSHAEHVARAMQRIDESESTRFADDKAMPRQSFRIGMIALAACLLVALFFVMDDGITSSTAMAAVQRSLHVAAQPITRKYRLQVQYHAPTGQEPYIDSELYVKGHGHFALRHPGLLPSGSVWIGKNDTEEWVVPLIGPVRIGTDMVLSRWLASYQQLDTPYLHIATLLERMSNGYRLELKTDQEIVLQDGATEGCDHIRAVLATTDEPNLPETIELWASRETGMALQIIVRWKLIKGQTGRESIVLTYHGDEPSLSDDWFKPESHYEGRRVIMRVDSLGQPIFERP